MNITVGDLFVVYSYVIFWIGRCLRSKKNMLRAGSISGAVAIAGFALLGSVDGMVSEVYSVLRNFIGERVADKSRRASVICFWLLLAL